MPMTSDGIYRLNLESTVGTVQMLNTFWYRTTNGADDLAQEIADEFESDMMAALVAMVHSTVNFDLITCETVTSFDPIGSTIPSPSAGTQIGEIVASYIAGPYRYNRATRETRNGQKRIGPMAEGNVIGNTFEGAYLTLMIALSNALEASLSLVTTEADPVIVRRQTTPIPWTDVVYNNVNSVQAVNRVSTQVSRKFY